MKIVQSESGDFFIVPDDKVDDFWEDELNEKADYAMYIPDISSVPVIDPSYLEELEKESEILNLLYIGGVHDWDHFDESLKSLEGKE